MSLKASAAGEKIILEVEDDGRGVDTEAVLERAKSKGIEIPSGGTPESVLLSVLTAQGFSTRDEADRVSGRGVGMAVVRSTVEELGGRLSMTSEKGKGTRFSIELPLTLAILDSLIVRVEDQTYAVPLRSVVEAIEVRPSDLSQFENNEIMTYRDTVLPLLRLSALRGRPRRPSGMQYALVVPSGSELAGLVVDRVVGQREIVVHGVSDPLMRTPGVSGATQLGDGQVILILDTAAVAQFLTNRPSSRAPAATVS